MPILANHKIIISSGDAELTYLCYKAAKEDVIKKFGESAIVYSGADLEPENGRWYAYVCLKLDKPLNEYFNIPKKPVIVLREVGKDDK
jgi:hypothetical protein